MTNKNPFNTVESHDNRGTEEHPFGYVYFVDGNRLGYAPGSRGTTGEFGLFEGSWGRVGPGYFASAEEYLKKALKV